MPLQSVYHCDSHAIDSLVSNPLNLVESTFASSITKPTLAERRSAAIHTDGDEQAMMMSGAADTWSDCESTHAVLGADDCGGMCQTATPSPNFFISSTMYDMYQDRYIPTSAATNVDKFSSHNAAVDNVANVATDSEIEEEEQYFGENDESVEMYSRSNSIVAFYRDEVCHMYDDEEEEILLLEEEEEEDTFNMSFVSDVATICSNESVTNDDVDMEERCSRTATMSVDSSYIYNNSASISDETHLLHDSTSDTTTTPDNNKLEDVPSSTSYVRVAYPSCTPASQVETRTLRSGGLMPQDPTTKYRKLSRAHGADLVHQVDISVLYEDHLQYVAQLYRANAQLTPSPFPFYSELQYQQQRRDNRLSSPSAAAHPQNGFATSLEQPTANNTIDVVTRPLQFLPPPPPSMQTYFVASHTFNCGTSYMSKFPASELHTKPGTGDWSAGYGPEYAATVEDGLPASRELYDPNCEAFSKFYEVLMRWYGGVCRAQDIHSATTVGNPLITKLAPVPSVEEYTTDFIGWVRELNRWWDAEVKPKTGSLHVLLSAHSSAVPNCLRRTAAPPSAPSFHNETTSMQSVPRSLAPPPLLSHPSSQHRHTDANILTHQHSITPVAVSSSIDATPAATHRAKPNNFIQCTNNNVNNVALTSNRRIW